MLGFVLAALALCSAAATTSSQPSCMEAWLMSFNFSASDANFYARSLEFRKYNVTVRSLSAADDQVLMVLGLSAEHRQLLPYCDGGPGPGRCLNRSPCSSPYECMYAIGARTFQCCRQVNHHGAQECTSGQATPAPTRSTRWRRKLKVTKLRLRRVELQLQETQVQLAAAQRKEAELTAALKKEKALQSELVASLVRNKEKAKNARKRVRSALELKRECDRSRTQWLVTKKDMDKKMKSCRAQLGWPVSSCHSRRDGLASESWLSEGDSLMSSNGHYRLEVRANGRVEAFDTTDNNRVFWSSGSSSRNGVGGYRLTVTEHGNVELRDQSEQKLWQSDTESDTMKQTCLLLQNDRSLALYGSCGRQLWSSHTAQNRPPP